MRNAVIVAYGRSAIGKAFSGKLKDTRPDDIAAQVVRGMLAKVPGVPLDAIDDFIFGCAFPEAEQGLNVAKTIAFRSGMPDSVAGQTVNRFCSSGLQALSIAANCIKVGEADVIVAGGIESMSLVPMEGNVISPNPYLMDTRPESFSSMGITAENVAVKYGISREEQDAFSMESHLKAAKAQADGKFKNQIIPVEGVLTRVDGNGYPTTTTVVVDTDEGVRSNISMEALGKLKTVFKMGGSVTAGNASQMSDGAAAVLIMSEDKAQEYGLKPIARFVNFAVAGVDPALMGLGPIYAIPKVLKTAGLSLDDIGLIELNEAFASQAIACIRDLGLNPDIINVNGGAIALGHPLGCTGALLTAKLLDEMALRGTKYGMISMCIGFGMGAAAILERCE